MPYGDKAFWKAEQWLELPMVTRAKDTSESESGRREDSTMDSTPDASSHRSSWAGVMRGEQSGGSNTTSPARRKKTRVCETDTNGLGDEFDGMFLCGKFASYSGVILGEALMREKGLSVRGANTHAHTHVTFSSL